MSEKIEDIKKNLTQSDLGGLFFDMIRQAIKAELQEMTPRVSMDETDYLLTVEQVAKALAVSEDWVYDNAKKLPFTRKLGPKMLRFSSKGLAKYLESRKWC